ncbi:hypothetical protein AVEN_113149-1, partial [Araneus ventricosus]
FRHFGCQQAISNIGIHWNRKKNVTSNPVILNRGQVATPELVPPNFRTTPAGGRLAPTYDLTCNGPSCTADLRWNWVSSLEPSNPKVKPYH